MSPEVLFAPRDPLHFTKNTPPSFVDYGEYPQCGESVAPCDFMASVDQSRKAPKVIGRISGQAQVIVKLLTIQMLILARGLTKLLEDLNKDLGLNKFSLLHNDVSKFFYFIWDRSRFVDEFIIGFHFCFEKLSSLSLDEELEGHILLRQANLDHHDRNVITSSGRGN